MRLGMAGIHMGITREGAASAAQILSRGKDLIAGSTRTFARASERHSIYSPGAVLGVNAIDEDPAVEIWPGVTAHSVALFNAFTRINDRDPSANTSPTGTFTVDPGEPSKHTWAQAVPGEIVGFHRTMTFSANADYLWQLVVDKNTTGRVRLRVQNSAGTNGCHVDFDLITGTFLPDVRFGSTNHDFTYLTVIDQGTKWALTARWRVVSGDGTGGTNSRMQIRLADDTGSDTGAAIPSQVIGFLQMTQNGKLAPYVPGAGANVASAADSLTLDPLPINFTGPGEIWAIILPTRWGDPFGQAGGNRYLIGHGPLDPPATEPWRNIGMNISTTSGGAANGGGNLGRGNGGGASPASVSAYSGTQDTYWRNGRRQYLGGSWNRTQSQIVFDALAVDGAATMIAANLPVAAQPPRTFSRLNLYPMGSAINSEARQALWGWPFQLTPAERITLSRALIRSTIVPPYP